MNILIADDDFAARRILSRTVAGMGDADYACDGLEAWEAISTAYADKDPYRLIFLDIQMPGMDGRELLQRIRALEASLGIAGNDRARIAMATVVKDPAHIIGSFQEECDCYIRKPYTRDSVLQDLRNHGML